MLEVEFQKQLLANLRAAGCVAHKFSDAPRAAGSEFRFTGIKYFDLYALIPPAITHRSIGMYVGMELKRYCPKQLKTKIESFSLAKVKPHQVLELQKVTAAGGYGLMVIYTDWTNIGDGDEAYLVPVDNLEVDEAKRVLYRGKRHILYETVLGFPKMERRIKSNGEFYKTKWSLGPLFDVWKWWNEYSGCSR